MWSSGGVRQSLAASASQSNPPCWQTEALRRASMPVEHHPKTSAESSGAYCAWLCATGPGTRLQAYRDCQALALSTPALHRRPRDARWLGRDPLSLLRPSQRLLGKVPRPGINGLDDAELAQSNVRPRQNQFQRSPPLRQASSEADLAFQKVLRGSISLETTFQTTALGDQTARARALGQRIEAAQKA
eukprot:gene7156-9758_t